MNQHRPKIALIARPDHQLLYPVLEAIGQVAAKNGCALWCSSALFDAMTSFLGNSELEHLFNRAYSETEAIKQAALVVAVGGDGTILYTAKLVAELEIPIMGVNAGRMGFMSTFQPEDFEEGLNAFLVGKTVLDKRWVLQATHNESTKMVALNEVAVIQADTSSLIRIKAFYEGHFVNRYWADGLIVSTPTGSTAYNLSLGGPIIYPTTPVLVLTPVNPHNLTMRPLVLPVGSLELSVEQREGKVRWSCDGFTSGLYEDGFTLTISPAKYSVFLVKMPSRSYFSTLRDKLMWGKDFRD